MCGEISPTNSTATVAGLGLQLPAPVSTQPGGAHDAGRSVDPRRSDADNDNEPAATLDPDGVILIGVKEQFVRLCDC